MNLYLQYIFIAIVIGFAIWYLYGMVRSAIGKKNTGCEKGNCGCNDSDSQKK